MPLGVTTSLDFKNKINRVEHGERATACCRAAIRSSASEYVIYTAHHDHLGVGEPDAEGDKIYNGAMDNASGVAQLLAIGKAFKALPTPPRRSIMLLFVAAEEQGLLGSKYYADASDASRPARSRRTSTSTAATSGAARKDVTYIGKGKSIARCGRRCDRRSCRAAP